jgi:peptidoglycan-associated lipoprotein
MAIAVGCAVLVWAAPAFAQERGTLEFGGFGSAATFNKTLTLDNAYGGGARLGMFLDPRVSVEFESGEMLATRTLGLKSVNMGILSTRLTAVPIKVGALSILTGAGAGIGTETNFLHSYGVNALVGAKIALTRNVAFRVDGVMDWLANYNYKSFASLHAGLSLYRNPNQRIVTHTVTVAGAAPPAVVWHDSTNTEDQARARRIEREYRELRDSLARGTPAPNPSSASALATMEEKIHFATDKSDLTPESKALLDAKVQVFRANPAMRIVIVGNTDERASDAYNMGLGERRSRAAKAYLVSQGIDAVRVEITSEGKRDPTASGTSRSSEALNRRDEFRLLIASDYLVPAKP